MTDPLEFKLAQIQHKEGLPLRLNGETVGSCDATMHEDGTYEIGRLFIADPRVANSLFDIDYSRFSFANPSLDIKKEEPNA